MKKFLLFFMLLLRWLRLKREPYGDYILPLYSRGGGYHVVNNPIK